jgi:uncharacterized membrane protein
MTLLVLGIAVPAAERVRSESGLWQALVNLSPSFVTYAMSFMTLGIFWVGQHAQMTRLERSDRYLTWIYLTFLFFVIFVPFSTQLLARFIDYRVAVVVYWFNIFALGAVMLWALVYGRRAGLFATDDQSKIALAAMRRRIYIAQALYAVATVFCIVSPYLSVGLIVLIQLNYAVAPRIPILDKL